MNQTRVAIYTRVSSEEQIDGYSLAAQQEIVTKFAEAKGWQVVKVYEERGRSGKTTIRPEFQALMADAKHKRFDVILVHKLDRFSRSLLDVLLSIKELHQNGVVLGSASEPMLDFSTPQGRLMAVVMAAFAEWYLDNLRDEITKGKRERARQGDWNGTLSYGYTTPRRLSRELEELGGRYRVGEIDEAEYEQRCRLFEDALEAARGKHETAAIPHPIDRPVTLAFSTYAQGGQSFADIAELLNQNGYRIAVRLGAKPFGKETIDDLLKNRFYTGQTQYKGEWGNGAHEPLISRAVFDDCQNARARRAAKHNVTPHNARRIYPLGGLLFCVECGTAWYGHVLRGSPVYRDPAREKGHQCRETVKSASAEELEAVIGDWLCSWEFSDDMRARLHRRASLPVAVDMSAERQRAKIQKQLENLAVLFRLADISQEEYLERRAELRAQLDAMTQIGGVSVSELTTVAELITTLRPVWKKATLQERKLILQRLVKTVYVRHGEIVAVEPLPVLWHLIREAGRIGSDSNINLPVKPLNSSIVYHFRNAKHSRHS